MPSSPIAKGIATILWGTDNNQNLPAGAIIESGQITPKNGSPIEIEGNNGFAATLIWLADGFDADFKMLYDTAKTWPANAAQVSVKLPTWGGAGGQTTYANCFVAADPKIDTARKKEVMIAYKIIYRPDVTS